MAGLSFEKTSRDASRCSRASSPRGSRPSQRSADARADAPRPVDEELLRALRLGELGRDARVDLLPDARHAEEDGRLHLPEIVGDLLDRLREVDRRARRERPVDREHLLGDVRERQVREADVGRRGVDDVARGRRRPGEVLVREHHALRRPRRARGVDEGREALRLERRDALVEARLGHAVTRREERVPVMERERRRVGRHGDALHEHDVTQPRKRRGHALDLAPLLEALEQDDRRLAVLDHERDLLGRAGRVDAGRRAARGHRGDVEDDPLGAVEAEDGRRPAQLEAERDERAGGPAYLGRVLGPGGPLPDAARLGEVRRRIGTAPSLFEQPRDDRVHRHATRRYGVLRRASRTTEGPGRPPSMDSGSHGRVGVPPYWAYGIP
jgi:hypothetical protein